MKSTQLTQISRWTINGLMTGAYLGHVEKKCNGMMFFEKDLLSLHSENQRTCASLGADTHFFFRASLSLHSENQL